jgi:hypothetical protein
MRAEKNNGSPFGFNTRYKVSDRKKNDLTVSVFKTGAALALNSPEEILKYNIDTNPSVGAIDCQSLICVPLKSPGKNPIGVLKIENTLDQEVHQLFSDKDIQDFQLLADIASEAIINFNNQAAKINISINKILSNSLDSSIPGNLNERLRKIAETFKEISNAVGVSIWLKKGSQLVCEVAVGKNYQELTQQVYDLSINLNTEEKTGLTAWIAHYGNLINIKNNKELM